jgi:hypothetical protein
MAKAYRVATYRSISNPDALAAYAKLAGPAITAAGNPAKAYESGLMQRRCDHRVRQRREGHRGPRQRGV